MMFKDASGDMVVTEYNWREIFWQEIFWFNCFLEFYTNLKIS